MIRTRIKVAMAVLGIGALTLAAAPAQAGNTVKTKVKITELSASGADGVVKSKSAKCRKARKVSLKFVGEYGNVTIGKDKTNAKGKWSVDKSLTEHGIYFASVKAKQVGQLTCAKATSADKRF